MRRARASALGLVGVVALLVGAARHEKLRGVFEAPVELGVWSEIPAAATYTSFWAPAGDRFRVRAAWPEAQNALTLAVGSGVLPPGGDEDDARETQLSSAVSQRGEEVSLDLTIPKGHNFGYARLYPAGYGERPMRLRIDRVRGRK